MTDGNDVSGSPSGSRPGAGFRLGAALRASPRRFGQAAVRLYRLILSPLVGFHCRHMPTCSQYSEEALDRFGLWAGGWMTLARLIRCQPWGTSGLDFVPAAAPRGARWYLPWRYGRWRGVNLVPAPPPAPSPRA